jgi:uncharacterized protein YcbX
LERLGTLVELWRYPVKSMAGEELVEARVTFAGITGDRVYAFVDNNNKSDFPWMTGRQGHDLILFKPTFLKGPAAANEFPDAADFAIEVTTPEGDKFVMGDPNFSQFLERRFGRSLRLRFSERSMTDSKPVSVFGLGTLRGLSEETGMDLDKRRFRANFYVRWDDDAPFFEDQLVGRELQIGEAVVAQLVKKDGRCIMITLDPDTAAPSPKVLESVYHGHSGCAGVYGAVLREGIVRAGDPIYAI